MVGTDLIIAGCAMLTVIAVCSAGLKAWRGWLDLKTRELDRVPQRVEADPSPGWARIELADLKERIRKLEAIAAGVDF